MNFPCTNVYLMIKVMKLNEWGTEFVGYDTIWLKCKSSALSCTNCAPLSSNVQL